MASYLPMGGWMTGHRQGSWEEWAVGLAAGRTVKAGYAGRFPREVSRSMTEFPGRLASSAGRQERLSGSGSSNGGCPQDPGDRVVEMRSDGA